MKLRNFWCKAIVDGRKTPVSFGPRGEDNGMSIAIFAKDEGESSEQVYIDCSVIYDNLVIKVMTHDHNTIIITIPKEKK